MTVRFSVTIDLHDVPTVRHVRDIEESIRLAVRGLRCRRADQIEIESRQIEVPTADPDAEGWIVRRQPASEAAASVDEERRRA